MTVKRRFLTMSKNSIFDIDDRMRQEKGTLAIEGFELDRKAEDLIKAKVIGLITEEEFKRKATELAYE
jgi:hypothetical protein